MRDRRKSLTLGGVCVSASLAGRVAVTDSNPFVAEELSRDADDIGAGKRSVSDSTAKDDWKWLTTIGRCCASIKLPPVLLRFNADRQADDDARAALSRDDLKRSTLSPVEPNVGFMSLADLGNLDGCATELPARQSSSTTDNKGDCSLRRLLDELRFSRTRWFSVGFPAAVVRVSRLSLVFIPVVAAASDADDDDEQAPAASMTLSLRRRLGAGLL